MKYSDYLKPNKNGMFVIDPELAKTLTSAQLAELVSVKKQANKILGKQRSVQVTSMLTSKQKIPMKGKGVRSSSFYRG